MARPHARFFLAGRRPAALASWVVVLVAATTLVVFAVNSRGVEIQKASLNDGGVWVTDRAEQEFGRENKPIRQLDLVVNSPTSGGQLDVLQNEQAVIAVDGVNVTPVDPTLGTARPRDTVQVKSTDVQLGGDVAAVADGSGHVWATHVDTVGGENSLDALAASAKPTVAAPGPARMVVSRTGTIYLATAKAWSIVPNVGTSFGALSKASPLTPAPRGPIASLTTVGEHLVWLDAQGDVGFAGHSVHVGKDAVLQQPGADASGVLVATPTALYAVDLGSGKKTTLTNVPAQQATAPVNVAGCAWGLWKSGTTGDVEHACSGDRSRLPAQFTVPSDGVLVFRVNRDQLFVNDMTNGGLWDVDGAKPEALTMNWKAFDRHSSPNASSKLVQSQDKQPPKAVEDRLGARAGASTVLHVLDNDRAPKGDLLSISSAGPAQAAQASVQVAPDQQSILATVNPGVAPGTVVAFRYTINDGESKNATATGSVQLTVKAADDPAHGVPVPRDNIAFSSTPVYPVGAERSIQLDVASDWRDKTFGDPVHLDPSSVSASRGQVSVTPDGQLRYVAPAGPAGPVTITYKMSTGGAEASDPPTARVVVAPDTADPLARPDVVAGVVNSPLTVQPLHNDVPGADPLESGADLQLAAAVAPQAGLAISSDTNSGVVTVTPSRAGIYTVPYSAKFGNAAHTSQSFMRLVVLESSANSDTPIATPDTTAVYGQSPMTVDVLANDYDPRGRLLVVQSAVPEGAGQLAVSVIDGRWLRVSARGTNMSPNPARVTYTISNGYRTASTTLTVSQLPAIDSALDGPDAEPDFVVVRAGTSVEIPVLDNDSTPSGDPVSLVVPDASVAAPGTLPLESGAGQAYLDGKAIRFVAPARTSNATDVHFSYTVQNSSDPQAPTATGRVTVHITAPMDPQANPDHAPTPSELDGRVVSGDTITLRLPTTGQDPDGDPVIVTEIGTADPQRGGQSVPALGQITGFGADTVTYQAFPGMTGADQFTFAVSDQYGQSAVGTARITVVTPGAPQPPVAVDDQVTVDPSRTLNEDVLANDVFSPGTVPQVGGLQGAPKGVTEKDGVVTVPPSSRQGQLRMTYTATNGLAATKAHLTVDYRKGFDNPPVAANITAPPQVGSRKVVVANLLKHVSDIDDPASHLRITGVDGLPATALQGDTLTLPTEQMPHVWTYHVTDGTARAVGSIYEAAPPSRTPHAISGEIIHVPVGGTTTVDVTQYVAVRPGARPYLTTDVGSGIFPEPRAMFAGVKATSRQQVQLTAGSQAGPASLVLQVADGADFNAAGVHTAVVALPVVVGAPDPVLTCPSYRIPVPESGTQTVDVGSVCHVWQDPTRARQLSYSASVSPAVSGMSATGSGSQVVVKAVHATAGSTGSITVTVDGTRSTGVLQFVVTALPPPSIGRIPTVAGVAGKSVSVDLAQYISSDSVPVGDFSPWVKSVTPTDGGPTAHVSGTTVTVDLPANEHRTFDYAIQASDSGTGSARLATGTLQVAVTDQPHWPAGYAPSVVGDFPQSDKVTLSWTPPDNGNSPILWYAVHGGPSTVRCGSTECTVGGLRNSTTYQFSVEAHNANGSAESAAVSATPDQVPSAVTGLAVTGESDGKVTYQWSKPVGDFSEVTAYLVSWTGGGGYQQLASGAAAVTKTIAVPNGQAVTFTVMPVNALGAGHPGPAVSVANGIASGAPPAPTIGAITGSNLAGGQQKTFTVNWSQVAPNGRGSVAHYELFDNGVAVLCNGQQWITQTACTQTVSNSGATHSYAVKAANDAGVPATNTTIEGDPATHQSPLSAASTVTAAGQPSAFTAAALAPTGNTGEATLSFTVGPSNGAQGTVTCIGDLSCSFDVGPDGGSASQLFTGLTDGRTYNVELQYCNGASANSALDISPCTTTTVSGTPYGPIQNAQLTAGVNDRTVTLNGSADANGGNVTLTITDTDTGWSYTCGPQGPSGTVTCSQSEAVPDYSRTYHYTLTATDASGHGRSAISTGTQATTGPQPNQPPTISNLQVINGGCGCGPYSPPQVGVSFWTAYPSGSGGGVCVYTLDGADLLPGADPGCAGNGQASHQFGSQPTGSHTYCAYIRMPDGRTSNQLCKTITVG